MSLHFITILITTKDRISDLKITLKNLSSLLNKGCKIIICDDGSEDNTAEFIIESYPEIDFVRNDICMGLIYSRNLLLNKVSTPYAISLDDDSNFLGTDPIGPIMSHFSQNEKCGVLAFRIYWGTEPPLITNSQETWHRVKSFVGCGHAWRMKAWKEIPDYPDWFKFYGEEEFASYHLFKKGWEVHYLPDVLIHHRVDVKKRKKDKNFSNRSRLSLRAAWYLYFIFLPIGYLPRKITYSIWVQLKLKVFKGDINALKGLIMALKDLFFNLKKISNSRDGLSEEEFKTYLQLPNTKIFWDPLIEKNN